jgi:xylulokinase
MSLLGIDVGTSGCKTVAFSEDGQALASAYREYATQRPEPGWAELDSREVWECVRKNIAEVAASVRNDPVGALCVSSMGEATTPVSLDRRVLGPCILSSDTRGSEYIRDLERSITQEEFYGVNPNVRLLCLENSRRAAAKFGSLSSTVTFHFTLNQDTSAWVARAYETVRWGQDLARAARGTS